MITAGDVERGLGLCEQHQVLHGEEEEEAFHKGKLVLKRSALWLVVRSLL